MEIATSLRKTVEHYRMARLSNPALEPANLGDIYDDLSRILMAVKYRGGEFECMGSAGPMSYCDIDYVFEDEFLDILKRAGYSKEDNFNFTLFKTVGTTFIFSLTKLN